MTKIRKSSAVAVERRTATMSDGQVSGRNFTGNAAVFNTRTAIGNPLQWGFYEQVAPGAFDKSIRDGDVVQLADHDPAKPLSRMSAGTLRLSTDANGLRVDSDLVETSYGDDLIANIRAGNVKGQSFGFQVVKDTWDTEQVETNDGLTTEVEVRTLNEVKLIEVSTTPFPAYLSTTADVRSAFQSRQVRGGPALVIPRQALMALGAEIRIGAALSAVNLATLQQVLDLIATADDAVDAAQPLLATLMGVANPDDAGEDTSGTEEDSAFPLDLAIRLFQLTQRHGLALTKV